MLYFISKLVLKSEISFFFEFEPFCMNEEISFFFEFELFWMNEKAFSLSILIYMRRIFLFLLQRKFFNNLTRIILLNVIILKGIV